MGMEGQRGSVKMFGKEIEFLSEGKKGKKKSFFPSRLFRFSKEDLGSWCIQPHLCAELARTITFPPTFFRFSSSLWILVGKGNFSAGTSTREAAEAAFRATSYPLGAINENERDEKRRYG